MLIVENIGIEAAIAPKDITGAAQNGTWVSLKNFRHLAVVLHQGAWAGGTPAVTLQQASDVSGTGAKSAPIPFFWRKAAVTAGQFAKTAVVSDTFNLPATANTVTVIEMDADQLDTNNGFDCVRVQIASPGANADLLGVTYLLSNTRFAEAAMPDAKVD